MSEQLLIPLKEVARLLGVHPTTVERRSDAGYLPRPLKVGRRRLWRYREILDWVKSGCPSLDKWHWRP